MIPLNERTVGGRYNLISELGEGGMGTVYRAHDMTLDRLVAVKMLKASVRDKAAQARFLREGQVVAGLKDTHIVQLLDQNFEEDTPFLVFELVEGQTLEDRIGKSPLSVKETLDLADDICSALEDAHSHDIIHRDLKPANVFVTKGGARLLDFGIAHLVSRTVDSRLTDPGNVLGTPNYMAPEYIKSGELSDRVDIWSLGVVMFECLTGRCPFYGPVSMDLIEAITRRPIPDLRSLIPTTPVPVLDIVERCMHRTPKSRWKDITTLRQRIIEVRDLLESPDEIPATQEMARTAILAMLDAQRQAARSAKPLQNEPSGNGGASKADTRVSGPTALAGSSRIVLPSSRSVVFFVICLTTVLLVTAFRQRGMKSSLNGEDDRGGATSQPSSPSTDTAALKPTGAETGAELERRINDLLPTRWEHEDETRWFLGNIGRSAKRVAAQSDTDEKALQKLSLAELGKKFEESGSPRKWNESAFRYSQMLTSGAASKSKASDEKSKASDEKLSFLSVARGLLAVGEIANPELRPARILLEDCMRPYWENPKSAKEFFSRSSTCWLATKEDLRADDARPQTWWQSNGAIELPAPESITSETWIAFVVSRSVRGWILEARVNEKFSMLFVGDIDEDATSTSYPTPHGTWQEPGIDMLQTLQGWKFFMKRLPTSALRRATSGRGKGGTTVKIQIQWIRHPASPASDAPSIWHVALLQPSL